MEDKTLALRSFAAREGREKERIGRKKKYKLEKMKLNFPILNGFYFHNRNHKTICR